VRAIFKLSAENVKITDGLASGFEPAAQLTDETDETDGVIAERCGNRERAM
jgi:hypothetical protein